jgi:predicted permease
MTVGELARRLQFFLRRRQCLDELEEEMRLHAELCNRTASRKFGNTTLLKERSRDMWGWNWLDDLAKDLRYALRLLRGNPMFTGIVVLTLALGIGANTAIFSVMNAVVLRSLPVKNPRQIVYIRATGQPNSTWNTGNWGWSMSAGVYEPLRADHSVFSDVMAYVPMAIGGTGVSYGRDSEEVAADMVSGNFFTGLGVQPVCGRTLTDSDENKHTQVAVLSYAYWSRRFGQTCSVVGRPLYIKGVPFTIVGVAASRFQGVEPSYNGGATDVWVPLQNRPGLNAWGSESDKSFYANPQWWCLMLIGRLRPGLDPRKAAARLTPIFQRAAYADLGGKPQKGEKMPALVFNATEGLPGVKEAYEKPLRVLLAMVGLILIIACSNIVMMLNARNAARRREFSVRLAIGGSKWRLFRQLMAESLLIVAAGTILGYLFAFAATSALSRWSALDQDFSPDRTVLLFTLAIMSLVALLFGVAPLRNALKTPVNLALKTAAATAYSDKTRMRARKVVIALQMCICLTLLVAAGLLLRTLRNLQSVDMGMNTQGLLVFGISPQQETRSDAETIRFYESLTNRLRGVPGVLAATLMDARLGSGWSNNTTAYIDGKKAEVKGSNMMRWNSVGPDYLSTLGIKLQYGRDLRESDSANSQKVVLINETFAKQFLKGQNPLGHHINLSNDQWTIVGVAADSKFTGVTEESMPMAYFPYKQMRGVGTMQVEVRTVGNPTSFLPVIQREVRQLAPSLPLLQPMTQQAQFDESYVTQRLVARLAIFFGLLAVFLVATGLYATLAYAVTRRTPEIGIRMAMGARRGEVLWMVLKESILLCVAGAFIGVPLALACSRVLRSMLFGVQPTDPLAIILGLFGLLAVALIASLVPARRAASIDPMKALRYE